MAMNTEENQIENPKPSDAMDINREDLMVAHAAQSVTTTEGSEKSMRNKLQASLRDLRRFPKHSDSLDTSLVKRQKKRQRETVNEEKTDSSDKRRRKNNQV